MELTVRPDDLGRAAAALAGCADRLDEAVSRFAAYVATDAPRLGADAEAAAVQGAQAAARAGEVVGTDITRIAAALRALASAYPRIDGGAVRALPAAQ